MASHNHRLAILSTSSRPRKAVVPGCVPNTRRNPQIRGPRRMGTLQQQNPQRIRVASSVPDTITRAKSEYRDSGNITARGAIPRSKLVADMSAKARRAAAALIEKRIRVGRPAHLQERNRSRGADNSTRGTCSRHRILREGEFWLRPTTSHVLRNLRSCQKQYGRNQHDHSHSL